MTDSISYITATTNTELTQACGTSYKAYASVTD